MNGRRKRKFQKVPRAISMNFHPRSENDDGQYYFPVDFFLLTFRLSQDVPARGAREIATQLRCPPLLRAPPHFGENPAGGPKIRREGSTFAAGPLFAQLRLIGSGGWSERTDGVTAPPPEMEWAMR